jgi:hypothetical protein
MAGMIVFGLLSLVFICCIFCGFKSIKLAVDVIDASADFVAGTKRVVAVPVLHFLIQILIFGTWLGAFICVLSLNKVTPSSTIP